MHLALAGFASSLVLSSFLPFAHALPWPLARPEPVKAKCPNGSNCCDVAGSPGKPCHPTSVLQTSITSVHTSSRTATIVSSASASQASSQLLESSSTPTAPTSSIKVTTLTSYTTLQPGSSGYTSTLPQDNDKSSRIIVVGVTQPYSLSTTFLTSPGATSFTSTISGTIVKGVPVQTVTKYTTLQPGQPAYTSTLAQGSDEASKTVVVATTQPYGQSVTYLTSSGAIAYTSTINGTVVRGVPVSTVTRYTTLQPGQSGYTSTLPQESDKASETVVVATTQPYIQSTIYLNSPGATAYTSTINGTILKGVPVEKFTQYTTLPAGQPGYTSTLPQGSDKGSETIVIATTQPYRQSTTYLTAPNATSYTSTINGTVVNGIPAHTTTSYTTLSPGQPGYTSTLAQGSDKASVTVAVGTTQAFGQSITYLTSPGATSYTSTINGTVVRGIPVSTTTTYSTEQPGQPGFTSTLPQGSEKASQTVVVGVTQPYGQSTTYLTSSGATAYTSTINGTVIKGSPISTVTKYSTLPPGISGYTSTVPWSTDQATETIVIGTTQMYGRSTTYLSSGSAYTSTVNGTIVNGIPISTSTRYSTLQPGQSGYTSTIPQGSDKATETIAIGVTQPYSQFSTTYLSSLGATAYTSTINGTIVRGIPVTTVTTSTSLPPGQSGYTSTLPQGSDKASETVVVGVTQPYSVTSTSYLSALGATPYTSTINGTIVKGIPVVRTTTLTSLQPGQSGYTSTLPQGSDKASETVAIGVTQPYSVTSTIYLTAPGATAYTSTANGTIVKYIPVQTTTAYSTLQPGQSGYTSILPQGSEKASQTVAIGITQPYSITSTTYLTTPGATPYTSTTNGTIVKGIPVARTTSYTTLQPGQSGYTTTLPQGSEKASETIAIGVTQPYKGTTTVTSFDSTSHIATIPASGTVSGTVITYKPFVTTTVTSTGSKATTIYPTETGATRTITVVYPSPSHCNNEGMQWAYYDNPYTNSDTRYSSFDVSWAKGATPIAGGNTTIVGIDHPSPAKESITIYGKSNLSSTYFALNHRGYIYAKVSGKYTFTAEADDVALIWVGPTAYSGWTRVNSLIDPYYTSGIDTGTYNMVQGQYYPFRVLYANGQGSAELKVTATAPDGTLFFGSNTTASPYLVQYSCDNQTAPPYSPYGKETTTYGK